MGMRGLFLHDRRGSRMFKAGTVAELEALELKGKIPEEVYRDVLRVVAYLDDTFGPEREVDFDDGGYVCIAKNKDDLDDFFKNHVNFENPPLEYVELISSEEEPYLNAFFLVNEYEFGITLFVPMSIAPEKVLREAQNSTVHR
jgi:hypothetical protein